MRGRGNGGGGRRGFRADPIPQKDMWTAAPVLQTRTPILPMDHLVDYVDGITRLG
ncbi:MAG: hypothetical protein ACI8T1_003848 [Verrucomicrobiales bacterium]|jgi:hypothetical protein